MVNFGEIAFMIYEFRKIAQIPSFITLNSKLRQFPWSFNQNYQSCTSQIKAKHLRIINHKFSNCLRIQILQIGGKKRMTHGGF